MAAYTPIVPVIAGVLAGGTAVSSSDTFPNANGGAVLLVTNGGGGSINATIPAQITTRQADGTFPAQTVGNLVVAVAAGTTKAIGPIPPAYVDSGGNTTVTYSGTTSVTAQVIKPSA